MKEELYKNSKTCQPTGLTIEAMRQYYWEHGFQAAEQISNDQKTQLDNKVKKLKLPTLKECVKQVRFIWNDSTIPLETEMAIKVVLKFIGKKLKPDFNA
jgi:nickel-dependent lactate racemase